MSHSQWQSLRYQRRNSATRSKRLLLAELLEPRHLLAGEMLQNPANPNDVNDDKRVSALDALIVVNSMQEVANSVSLGLSGEARSNSTATSRSYYLDVTGDGRVSAQDALRVINALRAEAEDGGSPFANDDFFSVAEDTSLTIDFAELFLNDIDQNSTAQVTITASNGFAIDSDRFRSTKGGLLSVDPLSSTFTYQPPLNFNGNDSFTYTIDSTPDVIGGKSTATVTINVTPINDGPINTVPASQTIDEDTPLVFSPGDFSVRDVDSDSLTVTIVATGGTVSVPAVNGVSGHHTNELTFAATTPLVVSNLLGGLTYTPDQDFNGNGSLLISATDESLSDLDTVNITIQPINDPPVLVVPGKQSFFTDFDNRFSQPFQFDDVDGDSELRVDLTIADGMLTAPTVLGQVVVEGNNSNSLSYQGFITDILEATNSTTYRVNSPGDRELTVTLSDGDNASDSETVSLGVNEETFLQVPDNLTIGITGSVILRDLFIKPIPGIGDEDLIRLAISPFNPTLNDFFAVTTLGTSEGITQLDGTDDPSQNRFIEGTRANINRAIDGLEVLVGVPVAFGQNTNFLQFVLSTPDESLIRDGASTVIIDSSAFVAANEDHATTPEDTAVRINAVVNDFNRATSLPLTITEVNGQGISIDQSATLPSGGQVTNVGSGFDYVPPLDFFGSDTFTYTVEGIEGPPSTATVTIDVMPVNDGPVAFDDLNFQVGEFSTFADNSFNLLLNDNPGPGESEIDRIRISDITAPANGRVMIDDKGTSDPTDDRVVYQPNPGFVGGTDSFAYSITDSGNLTDTATVTVNIVPAVRPRAADDFFEAREDDPPQILEPLANDLFNGNAAIVRINGESIIVDQVVDVGGGTVSLNEGLTYTPNQDFFGVDTFTYSITDDDGSSPLDTATITIDVDRVNDPPTVSSASRQTTKSQSFVVTLEDLLTDSQVGPANEALQSLRLVQISGGNQDSLVRYDDNGTPNNPSDDRFTYTPPLDFTGQDVFGLTFIDNGFTGDVIDPQTTTIIFEVAVIDVLIDVVAVDDGPFTFAEDSVPQTIDVLANDVINSGGTLTISNPISTQGTLGNAIVTENGTKVTYQPLPDAFGTDTFTYTITDGLGASDSATVQIEITPINDGPINTVPGSQEIDEDNSLVFSGGALSVADPDGDITVQVNVQASNGTIFVPPFSGVTQTNPNSGDVTLDGTTSQINSVLNGLTYTPNLDFNGSDVLQISTNDLGNTGGGFLSDTDTVNITINPINDGPINTVPGPQTLFNTETLSFNSGDFTVQDVDTSGLEVVLSVTQGTVRLNTTSGLQVSGNNTNSLTASGSITSINDGLATLLYDPLDSFIGIDTLEMTSSDGQLSDSDTVSITVTPPSIPFAASDFFEIEEDPQDGLTFDPSTLLNNDLTPVGSDLKITAINNTSLSTGSFTTESGSLTFDPVTSTFTYVPKSNFFGTDTFTYTIESSPEIGDGASTGTVNISIAPVNDGPTLVVPGAQSFFTDFDNTFSEPFQIEDIDAGSNDVQVDLIIGDGTLTISDTSGISIQNNGSNSLTITGPITDINQSLGDLTYRTSISGDKTLSATVNDLGNTGGGNLTASGDVSIEVEVLDFVPIDIIGQVFIDIDGDESRDNNDPGIEGIDVLLSGTDFAGNPVSRSVTSTDGGLFQIIGVQPSNNDLYKLFVQSDALFTSMIADPGTPIDARPGATKSISAELPVPFTLKPEFGNVFDLFGQSQKPEFQSGLLFGVGRERFGMFYGEGWDIDRFSNPRFVLNQDGLSGVLTVFDSQADSDRNANVSTNAGTLTYRGLGSDRVYRVIGGASLLGPSSEAVDAAMSETTE